MSRVYLGDVNSDGKLDIITADSGADKTSVFLGNENGTFQARTSYSTGTRPRGVALGDVNGDGKLDIVSGDYGSGGYASGTTTILLGNGNGTFQTGTSYSSTGTPNSIALGDTNADTFLDIVLTNSSRLNVDVFLANSVTTTTSTATTTTTLPPISFLSQASSLAALSTLASVQTSIENELANIGSFQSRLGTAISNLQQTRENYNAAESRIVDADIAVESANLVKQQILQNASSAILAQANQEPALLLSLLKP